jgi:demethylmenaquinone methyltransferase/2-methoxy-6-polyprenyl-1,4-benzoquinol methylase
MIRLAKIKIAKKRAEDIISMQVGDSEKLDFKSDTFDAVTVGFGVRNFGELTRGLTEMHRVTKPGGVLMVLEFSKPRIFPVKQFFGFYSRFVIPFVGRTVSKDVRAYSYLPASVKVFPEGDEFLSILHEIGYKNTTCTRISGGIASIYIGIK